MEFKYRVKELREQHGLLQKELAEKLGVSRYTIVRYESGKINPDIENVIKLSKIFDCSIDYLLGASNTKKPPDDNGFLVVIDKAKKDKVTPDDMNDILDLIKKLRKENL
jgi:transcriptional regulator with XRE-family HTH domain